METSETETVRSKKSISLKKLNIKGKKKFTFMTVVNIIRAKNKFLALIESKKVYHLDHFRQFIKVIKLLSLLEERKSENKNID